VTSTNFLKDYLRQREVNLSELKRFRDSAECPQEWHEFVNDSVSRAEIEVERLRADLNSPERNPILDPDNIRT